jgi:hypothetical protein
MSFASAWLGTQITDKRELSVTTGSLPVGRECTVAHEVDRSRVMAAAKLSTNVESFVFINNLLDVTNHELI